MPANDQAQLRWLVGTSDEIMARTAESFGVSPDALKVISSVHAIAAVLTNYESRLWCTVGLSPAQGWLVMKLFVAGPTRQKDLAADLMVSASAISQLATRLEAGGLVQRERQADDRRSSTLVLTDQGRSQVAALLPTIRATLAAVQDSLGSQTIEKMLHQLDRLQAGVEKSADLVFGGTAYDE